MFLREATEMIEAWQRRLQSGQSIPLVSTMKWFLIERQRLCTAPLCQSEIHKWTLLSFQFFSLSDV